MKGREIFDQAEDGSVAQMEIREAFDINKIDKAARKSGHLIYLKHLLKMYRLIFRHRSEDNYSSYTRTKTKIKELRKSFITSRKVKKQ